MKITSLLSALVALAFIASPALADTPSFRKAKDKETKDFVTKVGEAIVKAARTNPKSIELVKYEYSKPKDGKRLLTIKMSWKGSITGTKVISDIVVKIDVSDDGWEVSNIDYKDNNKVSIGKPRVAKIQDLIKEFNKK